jgi:hypothetical protein
MSTKEKPLLCKVCGAELWAGPSGWVCSSCDAMIEGYGRRLDPRSKKPAKLDIVTKGRETADALLGVQGGGACAVSGLLGQRDLTDR